MADPGRRSNKNSFRSWSTASKRSSLSPPVFRRSSHSLAPPGIWDVEFPKKHQCQQLLLKRSFSERGKPTRVFQQSATKNKALGSDSGAARSLWSAENKEYLEVRFGLMLAHCSNMKQQQQGRDSSFSLSSEYKSPTASSEASSIFSNPDCSSFSSGSCDDFSSCKDEPTVAPVEEEEQKQEGGEDEGEVFLDFALEQGNLVSNPSISQEQGNPVNNPRAVTRTNDHPAKRHDVDCSMLESPRSKLCSPSPPISPGEENIYPIWASAENKTPSHLTRSLTGMKLQEDHQDIQRRLNFSPGRFFPPKSPQILEQQQQQLGRIQQEPEVHCKSFFLRRPPSFMRRKRSKESPPMRPFDGYYTAQLHCVVRNDCQSFTFVVDGSEELLVARTIPGSKISEEDGDEQQQKIVCSFYSCKQRRLRASRSQSWKPAWPMALSSSTSSSASTCSSSNSSSSLLEACKAEASEIIASMKLSRQRRGDGALENEFVLTAVEHQPEPHSFSQQMPDDDLRLSFSSWEAKKSPSASIQPSQKRSWWNLVPGSPVLRRKNSKSLSTSPSRSRQEEDHEDVLKEIWKEMEAEESMRRAQAANRLQELAAFVVSSDPLKTLKESRPVNFTAVLPTGDHGMPTKGIAGPSPLMKRWRTGSCDCGGWDLGCTLDVFQNDPEEAHSKLLEISLQRPGRREEDAFTLVGLSNGLFSVKFREPFSALQAFGSAVAILFRSHYNDGAAVARSSESSHQWSKVLGLPAAAYQYPMHLERL